MQGAVDTHKLGMPSCSKFEKSHAAHVINFLLLTRLHEDRFNALVLRLERFHSRRSRRVRVHADGMQNPCLDVFKTSRLGMVVEFKGVSNSCRQELDLKPAQSDSKAVMRCENNSQELLR